MWRHRLIPVLLIKDGGLVKGSRFSNHRYVGDPINAVRIFNEKEVDELIILDISATPSKKPPDVQHIASIAGEAFMPMGYGGGITRFDEVKTIISNGMEKIIFNTSSVNTPGLISETAKKMGSASTVVSIDARKDSRGNYSVWIECGAKNTGKDPVEFAKEMEDIGAGEILINSIDNDGTMQGFDQNLIERIAKKIKIPLIASGGAAGEEDIIRAFDAGASAVGAGAMFVFHGKHKAVLITYPEQKILTRIL